MSGRRWYFSISDWDDDDDNEEEEGGSGGDENAPTNGVSDNNGSTPTHPRKRREKSASARSMLAEEINNERRALGSAKKTKQDAGGPKGQPDNISAYHRIMRDISDEAQRARCSHLIRVLPHLLLVPPVERFVADSSRLYHYAMLRKDIALLRQLARRHPVGSQWENYDALADATDKNSSISIEMEWQSVRLIHEQTGVIGTRLVASLVVDSRPVDAQAVFGYNAGDEVAARQGTLSLLPLYLEMLEDICSEHEYRVREMVSASSSRLQTRPPGTRATVPLEHTMVFEKKNTRRLRQFHESRELHRIYMEVPVQQAPDSPRRLEMQRLYLRNIDSRDVQSMHKWERMLLYPKEHPLSIRGDPPSRSLQASLLRKLDNKLSGREKWDRRFTVHARDGMKYLREDLSAGATARRYLGDLLFSRDYLKVFQRLALLGDSYSSLPYSIECAMADEALEAHDGEQAHKCEAIYRTPAVRATALSDTNVLTKEMLVPRELPALTQLRAQVNFTFTDWLQAVHDVTKTSQLSGAPLRSPPKRTCFVRYEHFAGEMARMLAEDLVAAKGTLFGQVRDVWLALSGDSYWIVEGLYRSGLFDTIHAVAVVPPSGVLIDRLMELSNEGAAVGVADTNGNSNNNNNNSTHSSPCQIRIIPHYLIEPICRGAPTNCPLNSNVYTERKAIWHLNSYLTDLRTRSEQLQHAAQERRLAHKSGSRSSASTTHNSLNSKGWVNDLRTDDILYWMQL